MLEDAYATPGRRSPLLPERPEKIELVSDGTSSTPTVNVMRIITAWTLYRS